MYVSGRRAYRAHTACWEGGLGPLPKILCLFLCDLQGLTKLLTTGMGTWAKRQMRIRKGPERSSLCNMVLDVGFLFFSSVSSFRCISQYSLCVYFWDLFTYVSFTCLLQLKHFKCLAKSEYQCFRPLSVQWASWRAKGTAPGPRNENGAAGAVYSVISLLVPRSMNSYWESLGFPNSDKIYSPYFILAHPDLVFITGVVNYDQIA